MNRNIKEIFNFTPKYDDAGNVKEEYHEDLFKVKKVPYQKDDMKLLRKFFTNSKHFAYPKRKSSSSGFRGGRNVNYIGQKEQLVTFKMSYSPSEAVHKAYLSTYMPQENKNYVTEKPVLFGTNDEEYEKNMTGKHFKCILSPENQNVNLQVLSSQFIKRIEVLTGFKFYWKAAIHKDTEHQHAHICINGKDKNGKEVYFQPEMIARTMRETLSYVATLMVGERTEKEIHLAKQNIIKSKNWTKIDEELEKYHDKISVHMASDEQKSRLSFLCKIGLAKRNVKYYELDKNWKETLTANGRFNTYLCEYNECGGNLELFKGGIIKGEVLKVINFDKDEAWNDALIINQDGKNYYVPVAQLKYDDLKGRTVSINALKTEKLRKVRNNEIKVLRKSKDEVKRD